MLLLHTTVILCSKKQFDMEIGTDFSMYSIQHRSPKDILKTFREHPIILRTFSKD